MSSARSHVRLFAILGLLALATIIPTVILAAAATVKGTAATRQARWTGEAVTDLTSGVTVCFAFAATSNYLNFREVSIANATGAFLYLELWADGTTGTVSPSDFQLTLKTSETLILNWTDHRNWFPIRGVGVYQEQVDDPAVGKLHIRGYE